MSCNLCIYIYRSSNKKQRNQLIQAVKLLIPRIVGACGSQIIVEVMIEIAMFITWDPYDRMRRMYGLFTCMHKVKYGHIHIQWNLLRI